MNSRPDDRPAEREAGRLASAEALRLRLCAACEAFIEGALENPALGPGELFLALRNPALGPGLLERLGRDADWMRHRRLLLGVVVHARTPPRVSRPLVKHLFSMELAEASVSSTAHPLVRREAERWLRTRLEALSSGEKAALARRVGRGLIPALAASDDSRVLRGLLGNVRMIEADAAQIAARPSAPPDVLALLAGPGRWAEARGVRMALLRNPRTPIPYALKLLRKLAPSDLRGLAGDGNVPPIVRMAARRSAGGEVGGAASGIGP